MSNAFPNSNRVAAGCRVAILVLAAVGLGACDRLDNRTAAEHLASGQAFLDKHEVQAAVIEFKTALQKDGSNPSARLLLADAYLALGDGQNAEVEIDRAEQLGTPVETTRLRRGRSYLLQGQFDRVLREIPATTDRNSLDAVDLTEVRADAQFASGFLPDAMKSYDEVLTKRPDSMHARLGKARVFARTNDIEQSLQTVDSALAVSPDNSVALTLKGDLLLARNQQDEAIESYAAAVKAAPSSTPAQLALASSLILAKRFDEAKEHIAAVRKLAPNLPSVNYLGALLQFYQGQYKEASDSIVKVIEALPDDPPALILAAGIQYQTGTFTQAELNARKFLKTYPGSVYGRKLLASILLKQSQPAKAFQTLEPMLGPPGVPDPQVFAIAGNALMQLNQPDKAVALLAKAATMAPTDSAIQTAFGLSSFSTGSLDRAILSFESALKLETSNPKAETYLVLSFIANKDFARAIESASAMVQRDPKDANAYNLLGGAYLAGSDVPSARTSFEKALGLQPDLSTAAINLARIDVVEKKPADARKHLTSILDHDAKNVDVLLALANLEFEDGHAEQGGQWLDTAVQRNPQALAPKILQMRYLLRKGEAARVVGLARDTEAKNPGNVDLLGLLAEAQARSGDRNGAVATYGRLAAVDTDGRYQLEIARLELADAHLAAGAAALAKALSIDPNLVDAQLLLAEVSVQQGRYEDAQRIAEGLQQRPAYAIKSTVVLGDAAFGQKKYDRAAKLYQSAFASSKTPLLVSKLHAAMAASGRRPAADEMIRNWIDEHPTDAATRLYLAAASLQYGDRMRATALYKDALRIDPDNVVALNEIALLLSDGDRASAATYAEHAYRIDGRNSAVADTYGWILFQLGEVDKSRPVLNAAVSSNPANNEARYHLAVALLQAGNKSGARAQLEAALQSQTTFAQRDTAQKMLDDME